MDIYTSSQPTACHLTELLGAKKPVEFWANWEQLAVGKPSVYGVVLEQNKSEFPFGLAFQAAVDDFEQWLMRLARQLSVGMSCRTLYTGCPWPDAQPYHSIVFDRGLAYLASDFGTRLAGDGDAPVALIRRIPELDWSQSHDF